MSLTLLEDRVKQFKERVENVIYSDDELLRQAEILIQDLWMSLQIYRALDKENRGR